MQKASARIIGPNGVAGIITFECLVSASCSFGISCLNFVRLQPNGSEVKITGEVTGLNPGFHGFHIHQFGDHSDPSCKAMGPHFNPANKNHGAPSDATRHAGDLGNIKANAQGVATIDQVDGHIALNGPNSIIGRGVVVHANRDDLGKGGVAESLKTGNAGGRIACGSIAIAKTV